jgi:epoxyqueuosine reductase
MPVADLALTERIKALARELGFVRAGVAPVEPLVEDGARLQAWLDAGYHGTMEYMRRTAAVRCDPAHPDMLAGARSVVVLAAPYARGTPPARGPGAGRVARYAQGRDYHNVLHKRLRQVTRLLRAAGHRARAAVDSMPVFERAWAQRAGVGFIGKNCCLIVPGIGSHVFLAAVVTSAELSTDAPMRERCGECRLCLDACPTNAFVEPRRMDARRCISYLTIEHRGPIEPALRPRMGAWIFGCDVCQDVCPFNRTSQSAPGPTGAFAPSERWAEVDAEAFLQLDEASFASLAAGSPVRRAKREGMARNAAIVLGNAGARRALPVLQAAAATDPSPVVREAASWAIERIAAREG